MPCPLPLQATDIIQSTIPNLILSKDVFVQLTGVRFRAAERKLNRLINLSLNFLLDVLEGLLICQILL